MDPEVERRTVAPNANWLRIQWSQDKDVQTKTPPARPHAHPKISANSNNRQLLHIFFLHSFVGFTREVDGGLEWTSSARSLSLDLFTLGAFVG